MLLPVLLGGRFKTYEPFISLIFQFLFFGSSPTADTESVDTAVQLYIPMHSFKELNLLPVLILH